MPRRVFFSFYYDLDNWRVSQVKQMGAIEGNPLLSANNWESIANQGTQAIKNWIDSQLRNKECLVVLIGQATDTRPWVHYEIQKAWSMGLGVMGVHIHNLQDRYQRQARKGVNPFQRYNVDNVYPGHTAIPTYDPPFTSSQSVYNHISGNLDSWIDGAIRNRRQYSQ